MSSRSKQSGPQSMNSVTDYSSLGAPSLRDKYTERHSSVKEEGRHGSGRLWGEQRGYAVEKLKIASEAIRAGEAGPTPRNNLQRKPQPPRKTSWVQPGGIESQRSILGHCYQAERLAATSAQVLGGILIRAICKTQNWLSTVDFPIYNVWGLFCSCFVFSFSFFFISKITEKAPVLRRHLNQAYYYYYFSLQRTAFNLMVCCSVAGAGWEWGIVLEEATLTFSRERQQEGCLERLCVSKIGLGTLSLHLRVFFQSRCCP